MKHPIGGTVVRVDSETIAQTPQGLFVLEFRQLVAASKRTCLKSPQTSNRKMELKTPNPKVFPKVGDEILILKVATSRVRKNGTQLAKEWGYAKDLQPIVNWVEEGRNIAIQRALKASSHPDLYAELLSLVSTARTDSRPPIFVHLPCSEELKALGLTGGYFWAPVSEGDIERFSPLNARRVDLSETEICIEGTPHGVVEVRSPLMTFANVEQFYGILSEDSADIVAWNPQSRKWEDVRHGILNIKTQRDGGKKLVGPIRAGSLQPLLSRFGREKYFHLDLPWLVLGPTTAKRFQQDLSKMPHVNLSI